jgi:hypothetical protein
VHARLARGVTTLSLGAVLILAGSPVVAQSPSPSSPAASPTPGSTPDTSIQPSPLPVVHHRVGGLGFDHPASWTVRPSGVEMRTITVEEFIGTAPSTAWCNETVNAVTCEVDLALEPGTVSVVIEDVGGPPMPDPFERAQDPPPGTAVVYVDGVPALLTRESDTFDPSASHAVSLFVPYPDRIIGGTRIRAEAEGPGEEVLWAQVDDLLASVHYEPALRSTDQMGDEAAAAAARQAIERLAESDPAFACFPRTPGASRSAVVRQLPFYSRLDRRLPVTCSTAIEGTPLELWKMALTSAWTAGPDRTAGSMTTTVWVGPDGDPGMTSGGGGDDPPYWP